MTLLVRRGRDFMLPWRTIWFLSHITIQIDGMPHKYNKLHFHKHSSCFIKVKWKTYRKIQSNSSGSQASTSETSFIIQTTNILFSFPVMKRNCSNTASLFPITNFQYSTVCFYKRSIHVTQIQLYSCNKINYMFRLVTKPSCSLTMVLLKAETCSWLLWITQSCIHGILVLHFWLNCFHSIAVSNFGKCPSSQSENIWQGLQAGQTMRNLPLSSRCCRIFKSFVYRFEVLSCSRRNSPASIIFQECVGINLSVDNV
jgi:hypothetical protein